MRSVRALPNADREFRASTAPALPTTSTDETQRRVPTEYRKKRMESLPRGPPKQSPPAASTRGCQFLASSAQQSSPSFPECPLPAERFHRNAKFGRSNLTQI